MKRTKKPKPPPSVTPHECVVLAVDTAERSGWALYVRGNLEMFGEVDMLNVCRDYIPPWMSPCADARIYAESEGLPAVLVYERPFRGTTQGQWIGAWKAAWKMEGPARAKNVGVYPATWRARVLGSGSLERSDARKREALIAAKLADEIVRPDEAAAICIGQWAIRCGEVAAKLPKRKARAV